MRKFHPLQPLSSYLITFLENCQRHPMQNKSTSVSDHFSSIPILTTLYMYPGLLCLVIANLGFVCLGFVMSSVCCVLHLMCLAFVMSSDCYVSCLLCLVIVNLGFVCLGSVMATSIGRFKLRVSDLYERRNCSFYWNILVFVRQWTSL